jgi:hypothetical protein
MVFFNPSITPDTPFEAQDTDLASSLTPLVASLILVAHTITPTATAASLP